MRKAASEARSVRVYAMSQPAATLPLTTLTLDDARYWVLMGWARWIKGKYLRMLTEKPLKLRDASCSPGPHVMHAAATGNQRALAIIEAWA